MAKTKEGEQRAAAPAADWAKYFEAAKVRVEELNACKSARARAIWIGKHLSPLVDREVAIEVKGRTGRAVLRVEEGRSNEKRYIFEVKWDDPAATEPAAPSAQGKAKKAKRLGTSAQSTKGAPKKTAPKKTAKQRTASAEQPRKKPTADKGGAKKAKKGSATKGRGNDVDW
jgi:hypothetical protein